MSAGLASAALRASNINTNPFITAINEGFTKVWEAVAGFFTYIASAIKEWLCCSKKEEIVMCEHMMLRQVLPDTKWDDLSQIFSDIGNQDIGDAQYLQFVMDIYRALAVGAGDKKFRDLINQKGPSLIMELAIFGSIFSNRTPAPFLIESEEFQTLKSKFYYLPSDERAKIVTGAELGKGECHAILLVSEVREMAKCLVIKNVPFAKALQRVS